MQPADVDLIGSHGQTVWHIPPEPGLRGATLQLGDPSTLVERTGIPVVSDFRSRDMAAGGHGAPLVPWQDRALFSLAGRRRVLQNIGGIANLTWLPPKGVSAPLVAFDTGPGNVLIDAAVELATAGRETFDRDGLRAARGRVDPSLLAAFLDHPFFQQPPPKSTGREQFGLPYLQSILRVHPIADEAGFDNLVATATALTARTIADAIRRWVLHRGVDEVVVSGGGAHNPTLLAMLRDALAPTVVCTGEALGVDPDAKEALAFAALAWAFAHQVPANVPDATGASGLRLLGSWTPAAPRPRIHQRQMALRSAPKTKPRMATTAGQCGPVIVSPHTTQISAAKSETALDHLPAEEYSHTRFSQSLLSIRPYTMPKLSLRSLLVGILLISPTTARGASDAPPPPAPREFRAVWVATVANIDWPSKPGLSADEQKRRGTRNPRLCRRFAPECGRSAGPHCL